MDLKDARLIRDVIIRQGLVETLQEVANVMDASAATWARSEIDTIARTIGRCALDVRSQCHALGVALVNENRRRARPEADPVAPLRMSGAYRGAGIPE